ncbi:MAG: T9SS type A sorting domain-containing protein [Crocinitomicaceae bacterium]
MKTVSILLGILLMSLFAVSNFFKDNIPKHYSSRSVMETKHFSSITGAFDYYKMLRSNVNTGTVLSEDAARARVEVENLILAGNRSDIEFVNHGPDNVGGRTRAILIDINNYNHIYAGSVSGGLFKSTNRGNTWSIVESFEANLGVSSMCQTADGTIFVATGHSSEKFSGTTQSSGMNGNGIYYSNDNGISFIHIAGSESHDYINEIVAKDNSILIAGNEGLLVYENGIISNLTSIQGACRALAISPDQEVIVASLSGNKTHISTDGGANFTNISGIGNGQIPFSGVGRMEYAISHEKLNGNYYIYASQSTGPGRLKGVYYTSNNGASWATIAPQNQGNPGDFAPFGDNQQGNYDQIITVVKGDPESILLGGIQLHGKSLNGNWELRSFAGVPPINPLYAHADQHEMQWDSQGRLWIGNDGGVFFSDDNGNTFRQANRGYSVTQFYRIAASAHGDVAGGTQDNGTPGNYHDNHTYRDHKMISGNDGFACDFSFMDRDVIYSTSQSGRIFSTQNRGVTTNVLEPINMPQSLGTPLEDLGPFHTVIELYENPNDLNSTDTISFAPTESMEAGEVIMVPSQTSKQFIPYTLTEDVIFDDTLLANPTLTVLDDIVTDTGGQVLNLYDTPFSYTNGTSAPLEVGDEILVDGNLIVVGSLMQIPHYFGTNPNKPGKVIDMGNNPTLLNVSWDIVKVQDVFQSWLAFGLGNGDGLWLTRNALRFSASHDGFLKVGGNMSGQVTEMEFSKDGDHLFVGTSTGGLYRLSGLASIYSPNPVLGTANGNIEDTSIRWDETGVTYTTETTFELVNDFVGPVTGITIENGNPNHVVVSLGGYGINGRIQESLNATTSSVVFNSASGNLPNMPCLSVLMDRSDPSALLVGTDFGLWRSENSGTTWEYCNAPFGKTPVFDLKQNWRTWDEGCYATGQIYIGTHGRGIWSTNEYLSTNDYENNLKVPTGISSLKLYPNPVITDVNISFDLKESGKGSVKVYDLTGRLVIDMQNLSLNSGNNNLVLGLSELSSGTYIIKLKTEFDSQATKLIKQ